MRVYTVHLRPGASEPDNGAVLVKEGFCWPAFFFSVLWALWHRMWLTAALFLVVILAAGVVVEALALPSEVALALDLAVALLIGWGANDLRRAALAREGYTFEGIVAAAGEDAAARRWFDIHPPTSVTPWR
jgi:hypothetical protein